jgi:hypothetical protein
MVAISSKIRVLGQNQAHTHYLPKTRKESPAWQHAANTILCFAVQDAAADLGFNSGNLR